MKESSAAIFYRPEGYDTSGRKLMGRHAAGEGFLKAMCDDPAVSELYCYTEKETHARDFRRRTARLSDVRKKVHWIKSDDHDGLSRVGTLYYPGPNIAFAAWERRRHEQRAHSICGVFHTTATQRTMDAMADFLVAPLQPWDAVVCPSHSVRSTVTHLVENWADYLRQRTGARPSLDLQLPIIPLGVDCAALAPDDAPRLRAKWRQRFNIGHDEICVLFMGRLSFHAKAHPLPMYLGLEEAVRRSGKRVHLIQAGWFMNDAVEKIFRRSAEAFCPSVNCLFVDGRDTETRRAIWFAADVFTALSDNIQETFGLVPIEAMAAGLPSVVSDWDGYRETIRDGVDGITVPTWQPCGGSGLDLAALHAAESLKYDHYIGATSQATAVDVHACAEAYTRLISDPELRGRMGSAARRRARDVYDWPRVLAQYHALWAELAEIRGRASERAPAMPNTPSDPRRDDPFSLFASYPTHRLHEKTRVSPIAEIMPGQLKQVLGAKFLHVLESTRGTDKLALVILAHLRKGTASVGEIADAHSGYDASTVIRAVGWLAKCGLVRLDNPER